MVIAGCLNQARNIFEKYDEILYGPAPEKLVEETHSAIRGLLSSQECRDFLSQSGGKNKEAMAAGDNFVRKITEAVAPILPITLRNKSLDGGYFRTALHLVAAAEFIFAQYEADIRNKANPAGVVGMCNIMHSEIKRSAMYNDELKSLGDFVKEMKSQYQTSLGLGSSFARDPSIQGYGRGRRARGRSYYRTRRYRVRGMLHTQGAAGFSADQGQGVAYSDPAPFEGNGAWRNSAIPVRGRGACYAFLAGTCNRGRACRFSH